MNTKAIFTIVAIVAAIGMLSMAAVAIPSVHADTGGIPNLNSGGPQRGGIPSLQNGNQIHPAVNGHPGNNIATNTNPTKGCLGAGGHSNIGEPCTG